MPDPFEQLASQTIERDYGERPPSRILGGGSGVTPDATPAATARPPSQVLGPAGGPPLGTSYENLLDGLTGRGGTVTSVNATPPAWPPSIAVSPELEAEFGPDIPVVPPRDPKPGLWKKLGTRLGEAFTGGPRARSPEELVAERGFAAQAEIEARQHPYFANLPTDEAKLRFLNVFRRRYGLEPTQKLEQPAGFKDVAKEEFGTVRGLMEKLPYIEPILDAAELVQVHRAIGRVTRGEGTLADFETIAQLQERMAKESRGKTWGGTVAQIPSQSIPFMGELATGGGFARGAGKVAEKVASKTIGKTAQKAAAEALRKMAGRATEKTIAGTLAKAGVETVRRGMPSIAVRTTADTLRRTLPGFELRPGDDAALEGAMTAPGQPFLGALRDSSISATIEIYSEYTGKVLGHLATKAGKAGAALVHAGAKIPGVRRIAVPAERAGQWVATTRAALAAELAERFPNKYASMEAAWRQLRDVGYNQPIEEMGEERVAEIMEAAAKAVIEQGGASSTLQEFEAPTFGQMSAEFAGFLIPGAARLGAAALTPEDGRFRQAMQQGWQGAMHDRGPSRPENLTKPSQSNGMRNPPYEVSAPPPAPPGPGEVDIPPVSSAPNPPPEYVQTVPRVDPTAADDAYVWLPSDEADALGLKSHGTQTLKVKGKKAEQTTLVSREEYDQKTGHPLKVDSGHPRGAQPYTPQDVVGGTQQTTTPEETEDLLSDDAIPDEIEDARPPSLLDAPPGSPLPEPTSDDGGVPVIAEPPDDAPAVSEFEEEPHDGGTGFEGDRGQEAATEEPGAGAGGIQDGDSGLGRGDGRRPGSEPEAQTTAGAVGPDHVRDATKMVESEGPDDADTVAFARYQHAMEATRRAQAKFREATEHYRAKRITDEEFLHAQKVYQDQNKAFDEAERQYKATYEAKGPHTASAQKTTQIIPDFIPEPPSEGPSAVSDARSKPAIRRGPQYDISKDSSQAPEEQDPANMVSRHGRKLSPFPDRKITSQRMANKADRELDLWLLKEAIEETYFNGDEFNRPAFEQESKNLVAGKGTLPPASRTLLNEYLFGREDTRLVRSSGEKSSPPAAATPRIKVQDAGFLQQGDVIPGLYDGKGGLDETVLAVDRKRDGWNITTESGRVFNVAKNREFYVDRPNAPVETPADQPEEDAEARQETEPPGELIVRDLQTGATETITPEKTAQKKAEVERLREKAKVTPTQEVDTQARWMNDSVMIQKNQIINGIEYTLAHGKTNGYVRVYDLDSSNVVSLKRFPSRALADQEYADVISKAGVGALGEKRPPAKPLPAPGESVGHNGAPPVSTSTREPVDDSAKPPTIPKEAEHESRGPDTTGAPDRPGSQGATEPTGEKRPRNIEGRAPEDVPGAGGTGTSTPVGLGTPARGGTPDRGDGGERAGEPRSPRPGPVRVPEPAAGGVGKPAEPSEPTVTPAGGIPGKDFIISDPGSLFASGGKTIFRRNVNAIRIVKRLQAENRPATEEERADLVKYQGWGSLPDAFVFYDPKWVNEARELKELLTAEEYQAAMNSTKNAMYTPPELVQGMWRAVERMGFKGGAILEPSAGVGHFLGLQPGHLLDGSRRVATEMDAITAAIAKAVYPASDVRHTPFQKATLPKNYFDVAIGNVPFGALFINDNRYPKHLRQFIHDYFFVRSLDLVRPGGLVAFITTKGTMDKADNRFRSYMAERADLIGAIRLNEDSLPGTKVTADIIFLKKRAPKEPAGGEAWVNSIDYAPLPGKIINEYFQRHPEMVMGTIKAGSQYSKGEDGPTETTVEAPKGFDLGRDVGAALDRLPENVFGVVRDPVKEVMDVGDMMPSPSRLPPNTLFVGNDGKLYRAGLKGEPAERIEHTLAADKGPSAVPRAKALIDFRDTVLEILRVSADPRGDERLNDLQAELNKKYDALARKKFTNFRATRNSSIFADDPITLSLLTSDQIEKKDPATKEITKGDIFTRRMLAAYERPTSAESTSDALAISLDETNTINLERMAELLSTDQATVRKRLLDEALAYALPGDQLILAAEYLSGPVRAKLHEARAAAELDPQYQSNVTALERVQPPDLTPSQIKATIGAPWIPGRVLEDFVVEQAGERFRSMLKIRRIDALGQWVVDGARYIVTPKTTEKWGTADYNMAELIEDALNMKVPKVVRSEGSGENKITWTDQPATDAAITKLREVRDFFETWVWAHPKWGPELLAEFNRLYNDNIKRVWDGSHLTLPGSNPLITLRSYQKDTVYRTIASEHNTLADVAVGGGKTFIAAAAAMEMLRLNLARKVVIVVDRATLDQFVTGARTLYPSGRWISLSTKELAPKKRARTLANVALADKTVFVMPHTQFTSLPVTEQTLNAFYNEMMVEIDAAIEAAQAGEAKVAKRQIKRLQAKRDNLQARLEAAVEKTRKIASVPFEELGIDWIVYDEAHKVKNLRFETMMEAVRGLGNPAGSQVALDVLMKTQYVSRLQNGRGVTFLTGTPINNSISELYAMQRYLQPSTLLAQGIRSFDDWVRLFATEAADFERVAGRYKWVTRLREFKNLKGLYGMWEQIAHSVPHDVVVEVVRKGSGDIPQLAPNPDKDGARVPTMVVREVTPGQKAYQKVVNARREAVLAALKKGPPQKGDDIMLSIITDEKKAAIDMRFIYPDQPEEPGSKITACVNQVVAIHKEFEHLRLTQAVYLNIGTPDSQKVAFPAYADIIQKLVAAGIPRDEIATIFDPKTDSQKAQLFERFNKGEIRILIGSMKKMGQGVNIQKRLIALHALEPAWEPGTLIQLDGRILRSGNEIVKHGLDARIYRYVSNGMSDEAMYGLLATKQKINSDFLTGRLDADTIQDLDIGFLAFQMAQAEGAESKTVFEWTKADQQLRRLQNEARYHRDTQMELRNKIVRAEAQVKRAEAMKPMAEAFVRFVQSLPPATPFVMQIGRTTYDGKMTDAGKALFAEIPVSARGLGRNAPHHVGSVRGMHLFLDYGDMIASGEFYAKLTLRLPAGAEQHAKFLAESGFALESQLFWTYTAPPTDTSLANWVSDIVRRVDKVDAATWDDLLKTQKQKAAELEEEIGKPFARQQEMNELADKVSLLAAQLSKEAEDAARAGEGHEAEDMGQGGPAEEEEAGDDAAESDEGEDEGGASSGTTLPPKPAQLMPDWANPETRRWLRDNWQRPVFGMGATSAGPPAPGTYLEKAWETYANSWDKAIARMKDMPTRESQALMDWTARLLYGGAWKLPAEAQKALDEARGAKHVGAEVSAVFNEALDKIIQSKRQQEVGKPWPEESWNVIRQTALAVLKGGHRRPDILPRDMKKVWDAHFRWVRHVPTSMTPRDRRLEIEHQLEKVDDRIADLLRSTLVQPMPAPAWDAYAIAEHRRILDVVNGDADYDSLDGHTRQWLEAVKAVIDRATDEMLGDPVVMEASKGGGLVNFEEIVRMRRQSGAIYLRSLYHIVRDPSILPGMKRETLGPRLVMGMTKGKRARDLWTVTLASGQEMQFHDEQEAITFAEQERALWQSEYGESIKRRVTVRDPLSEDQIEWLGPVEDVRVLVAKTITGMYQHIDTARTFATLDALDALDEREYMDLSEDEKHKYRKLPDSPSMFRLAGKYVPEAVHYNLMDSRLAFTGVLSELWSMFLQMFKSAVVVLNPPTWFRQLYGQTVFWILRGINPITHRHVFVEAARRLSMGMDDPIVYRLMRLNQLHGGVDKVFAGAFGDSLKTPTNGVMAALGETWHNLKLKKRELGRFYQFIDHVSIVASWIQDTAIENLPEEYALENLKYFQNYERIGTAARFLRKFPLGDPFASFADQAMKIVLKGMREHPGRVLAMYAAPAMINMSARLMFGVTDEEMQILNTHPQRRSLIDRYFQPVFYRDSAGIVHTLDLRWSMPLASDFRVATGAGGLAIPFTMKQPLFGPMFEVMFNRESYSGRELNDGEPLTFWKAAAHIVWESAPIPTIAHRAPLRLYRAATGESGENFVQVLLKEVFGVSMMPRYATKSSAYRLVREAINDKAARRAVKLIEAYNRLRRPGSSPISGSGVQQSMRGAARAAARRELQRS